MEITIDKERLVERFLRYVAVDTQSDPESETFPSTAKQLTLLNLLLEEMLVMGLADVEIDPHGYVTGTIPATQHRLRRSFSWRKGCVAGHAGGCMVFRTCLGGCKGRSRCGRFHGIRLCLRNRQTARMPEFHFWK